MKLWCAICKKYFKGRKGTALCDFCKIEILNKQKIKLKAKKESQKNGS